jgi:hypothetical protein
MTLQGGAYHEALGKFAIVIYMTIRYGHCWKQDQARLRASTFPTPARQYMPLAYA